MEILDVKIDSSSLISVIKGLRSVKDVDVEHEVSLIDDQLQTVKEKLDYAIKKLEENEPSVVKLIIRESEGFLLIKIEDVISIRIYADPEEIKNCLKDHIA